MLTLRFPALRRRLGLLFLLSLLGAALPAAVHAQVATTTTVAGVPNPSVVAASVTFTATVQTTVGSLPATAGTVTFKIDGSVAPGQLPTGAPVNGSGQAAYTTSALSAGPHTIEADYSGGTAAGPPPVMFGASSGSVNQVVKATPSVSTPTSTANPSVSGQDVTFSAGVTGGYGTATGTITFTATLGAVTTTLGTVSLSNTGTASLTTDVLPASATAYTVTANYSGDGFNTAGSSAGLPQTVNKAGTTTGAPTPQPASSTLGQAVTLTSHVSVNGPGTGAPTGTVTFTDSVNGPLGTVGLDGNGNAALTTTALSVSSAHSITASYSGDGEFSGTPPPPPALAFSVGAEPTTTSVTSSINPSGFGQPVVFTVTVTGSNGLTPNTGTVNISNGGGPTLASATLNGNGQAQITLSSLPVGADTVTASYVGTGNFAASSGTVAQAVNAATDPVTLTSAPNPSTFNANVTFTLTVQGGGPSAPTGTATFFSDGVMLGTGPVTGGTATFSTSSLSVGTHSITAAYGGDGNYNAGASGQLTQIVNQGATTTALSPAPSPSPSAFGVSVTFSALITATGGGGAPTGTVQFIDTSNGNVVVGAVGVSAAGATTATASFSTASLSVGTHAVRAVFSGDGTFAGSASATFSQMVTPSATTPVQLTANPTATSYGQSVSFTATVNTPTALPAGSSILFKDSGVPLPSTPANPNPAPVSGSSKTATVTAPRLNGGSHTITADFTSGDTGVLSGGTTSITYNVAPATPTLSVTSDAATSGFQQPVTFTATAGGVPGAAVPTGAVQFFSDGSAIGAAVNLSPAGPGASSASLQFKDLPGGKHTITAIYAGDGNYSEKVSDAYTQTVLPAGTLTGLTSSANPSTFSQSVTFTATVTSTTPGAPIPGGSITFQDGSSTLATISLSGGQAAFTTSALSSGPHTITAQYNPSDGNFATSSGTVNQIVNQAASNVVPGVSPNPSTFGQPVTFTVVVTSQGGVAPTGTITFALSGVAFGSATLAPSGRDPMNNPTSTATFITSALPAGADQVIVTYSGDVANAGGSVVLTQTIFKANTATAMTSSVNPSTLGQPVTLTASVVDSTAGSQGAPTGTVTFLDGGTPIPSSGPANPNPAPLHLNTDGTVTAAFTTTILAVATDTPHTLSALYNADGNFNGSAGLLRGGQTVFDRPASVTGLSPAFLLVPGTSRDGSHAPLGPSDSQVLTITGTNFRSGSFVLFDGDKLTPTTVAPDGTSLNVLIPPGDVSVSGFAQVQVVNRQQAQTGADPTAARSLPINPVKAIPNFPVTNRPDKFLRMFSIPFDYTAFSPYDVLAGVSLSPPLNGAVYNPDVNILAGQPLVLSGATTPLYHWDPASLLYQTTLPNADPTKGLKPADLHLTLGQGFWIVGGPQTQTLGVMRLGTPAAFNPIGVPLQGGWNMIGDPFPRDVPLNTLRVLTQAGTTMTLADAVSFGLVSPVLWRWDGTQYVACFDGAAGADTTLQQYEGYWLFSYQPVTLLVTFPQ